MICTTHMFVEIYLLIQVALIPIILREFGVTILEASLVATVPNVVALIMNVPSGFMADHFTPRQLLAASMVIEGIGAFLVSQTTSFWAFVLALSFMKISSPIYHVSGLSQISHISKPEQMSKSVGFHNALGNVGATIGMISLTVSLTTLGWRWSYLFWALPLLVWALILFRTSDLGKPVLQKTDKLKGSGASRLWGIFTPALLAFLAAVAVRETGAQGSSSFTTTYFEDTRGMSEVAGTLIFALGPLMGIIGSIGGGYLGHRLGAKKALTLSILICSGLLSALAFVSGLYVLAVVYASYAFFSNTLWSPMNLLVANVTPGGERGLGYSIYFLTEGLADTFAPAMAAWMIQATSIWSIFPLSSLFMVASVFLLQLIPHSAKNEQRYR